MVFNKKKGMMVKSSMKNEASSMGTKKNIFKVKREEDDDDDDDFEDSDGSVEMPVDEDEGNQSMNNSKKAKSKMTPGGKKDMHVSFQFPNKGGSATKMPKSLQNTPQSGKKNQNATSPKQNTPMPGKKNQLSANPSKNYPMYSQKHLLAAEKIFGLKKNQGSLMPTHLKQFGGIKPNQNARGKSKTNSMDHDDDDEEDDDDDEEEDDDDDDEEEDDDEEDETEDMPTPGQKLQPQNNPSKKFAMANNKQQLVKSAQNIVQNKKNQAVLGNKNSNAALQGKKVVKGPSKLIAQQEEDDDDDDDDDDEEVDEEEEKKAIQKKLVSLKQDIKSKLPENKKKGKKGLTQETPKSSSGVLSGELLKKELERKKERDSRCLYMKGFATGTTAEEIKALSSDILLVIFPKIKKMNRWYCFLGFESEEKAVKNHKQLQGKKLNGHEIFVDFVGAKSKKAQDEGPRIVAKNRLLCEGIPVGANFVDIAQLFPKAFTVTVSSSSDHRTAHAAFQSDEDAAEAFNANENAKIHGKSVVVTYAIALNYKNQMKRKGPFRPGGGPAGKRQRQ